MHAGKSMFWVFGWWVAWVYALSLALPAILPRGRVPDESMAAAGAPEVRFASNGFTLMESNVNGLLELEAVLTRPVAVTTEVPVEVGSATAKEGKDYRVVPTGAIVLFEKGGTAGRLRLVPERGPDVTPINDDVWTGARSFRLRLVGNGQVAVAGDAGLCTVTIQDDDPAPKDLTPIRFVQAEVQTTERELVGEKITAEAESAVPEKTIVEFHLFRTGRNERVPLATFQQSLAPGDRRIDFRLKDVLGEDQQQRLGMTDDRRPGPDESYELEMLAPPPLYPAEPGGCRIVAADDDDPPALRLVYFDEQGREIRYLDPRGGMTVELDGELPEDTTAYDVTIDGQRLPVGVVIPGGQRRGNVLDLARSGTGISRGRRCGVSVECGKGCCRGQKGVSQRPLVGVPVPGDALVVLVNNGRLHERGDRIVDEVRAAIASNTVKLYDDAVVILNREGEDRMTGREGRPDPAKAYRPFEEAGDDVAGQLKRIEEFVARKREGAEREDLRAVVIWPERDLAAGEGLSPAAGGSAPISFLFPDADPSYARAMRRGLMPQDAAPGSVTVRSPAANELESHLRNVLDNAAERPVKADGGGERSS
jgi:hypothetical protein